MTKIDIYSGFLGAGKTTLIKKLVAEAYKGQKIMIIENEFGEIGIDGGFLQDAGVQVREMNSGCICCSLTGDFKVALKMALEEYAPDRIVIEPSGVGKLSEVAAAVMATGDERLELGGLTTVVDASKCKMYLKNFGEFFKDQVGTAHTIVLSRTGKLSAEKVEEAVRLLRELNDKAQIVTADWDDLDGKEMLAIIDGRDALSEELAELIRQHVEETMMTRMNTNTSITITITTTMTTMMTMTNTSIITIITTTTMNTVTITIITTIITMASTTRTKCSPAGARRPLPGSPFPRSRKNSRP